MHLDGNRGLPRAVDRVVLHIREVGDQRVVDPHLYVRSFSFDAYADRIPLLALPRLDVVEEPGALLVGRGACAARAADTRQPVLAVDVAEHAGWKIVERYLIRHTVFGSAEEEAAVASPVRLDLHVELEILVLPVGNQDAAAAKRTLRAE